jgi:hypothetical protein
VRRTRPLPPPHAAIFSKPKAEQAASSRREKLTSLSIFGELPLETGVDGRRNPIPLVFVQVVSNRCQLLRPRAAASSPPICLRQLPSTCLISASTSSTTCRNKPLRVSKYSPTLNIYYTYMSLPFDETKRTWQKMAHTLTTKPRLTCRPEAEHPRCRRAAAKRRGDKETAVQQRHPPGAARKGPGAGNAAETQKTATSQTPAFGLRAAVAAGGPFQPRRLLT